MSGHCFFVLCYVNNVFYNERQAKGCEKMGTQAVFSFIVYVIINAFAPGPGNVLAFNTVSTYGWKKGENLFLGIFVGYYCVQAVCAVFTYGLGQVLNPVLVVLKYVGAAYIVWLAIHILRSKPESVASDKKPSFWVGFVWRHGAFGIYRSILFLSRYASTVFQFYMQTKSDYVPLKAENAFIRYL